MKTDLRAPRFEGASKTNTFREISNAPTGTLEFSVVLSYEIRLFLEAVNCCHSSEAYNWQEFYEGVENWTESFKRVPRLNKIQQQYKTKRRMKIISLVYNHGWCPERRDQELSSSWAPWITRQGRNTVRSQRPHYLGGEDGVLETGFRSYSSHDTKLPQAKTERARKLILFRLSQLRELLRSEHRSVLAGWFCVLLSQGGVNKL